MTTLTWKSVILPLSARLRAPSFLDARLERNPLGGGTRTHHKHLLTTIHLAFDLHWEGHKTKPEHKLFCQKGLHLISPPLYISSRLQMCINAEGSTLTSTEFLYGFVMT